MKTTIACIVSYREYGLFDVEAECLLELVSGGTNYVCFGGGPNAACPNVCDVQDLACPTIGPLPPNLACGINPCPPQVNPCPPAVNALPCQPDRVCRDWACGPP